MHPNDSSFYPSTPLLRSISTLTANTPNIKKREREREEGKKNMKEISLKYRPRYKIPHGWSKLTGEIKRKDGEKPGGFSSFFY